MYRFRNIGGAHVDKTGKVYRRGQVIESETDLRDLHPEKFVLIEDDETVEEVVKKTVRRVRRIKA